ncbi:MAG TPA: MMPL family transporter [Polyangiaceae bacterium]|nr:MMPL family transporter [Polyangiaceae bacterium]
MTNSRTSDITARIGDFLSRLALLSFRRPWWTLLCVLLVTAAGAWSASRLRVDPDLAELLPESYESVQDLETLKARFGGVGYVVLLFEGGSAEERRAYARALEPKLAQLETVSYVELEKPAAYLKDKALWLLDLADLRTLHDRVEARYRWEIDHGILDLDDSAPPPVETADVLEHLRSRFGPIAAKADESNHEPSRYFEDADKLAVFVRPKQLATNFDFAKRVVADVTQVLDGASLTIPHGDVHVELTGRYKKRVDLQGVLSGDLGKTSLVSLLLVAGYLAFHFRRPTAVVLLLLPLNVGLVLAYGLASLTFGTLNVLTAFLGAILVGIGVDSGIHLLGRVHEERAKDASLEEAVAIAFREAGRVSLAATLTTAAAFTCLTWTDFRAFREFGTLTAIGVVLVLLSYLVMQPALLRVASRYRWASTADRSVHLVGTGTLAHAARWLVPVLGVVALGLAGLASRVHFDADLSRLDDADLPSFRLDKEVTKLLGRSQTPLVAFAEDDRQARELAETIRAQMRSRGDSAAIGEVATLSDILPHDVDEKRPLVARLAHMASHIRGPARAELERNVPDLDRILSATPPTRADLPQSIRQVLAPRNTPENAKQGPLVLLYPRLSLGKAETVLATAEQVRHVDLPSGEVVRTAGEPMILADILGLIAQDGPRILALTLVLVFAFLRLTLGSFRLATLATIPAVLTLLVTAGALFALGISLNVLNIIILPVLLGIGVDDGAHIVARLDQGEPLSVVWAHTGADVAGAILTDVFGFGVLAFASHPGLASLGQVALVGLTANFLLCVVLLPAVLSLFPLVRGMHQTAAEPAPAE